MKKTFKKKNIEPILGNEGDEIKKLLIYLKNSYWGWRKKQAKQNIAGKNVFLCHEINLFFSECFFYLSKLPVFFGNQQQSNARAGQIKNTCFFGNALPESNARAHLKQSKKTKWPYRQIKLCQEWCCIRRRGLRRPRYFEHFSQICWLVWKVIAHILKWKRS